MRIALVIASMRKVSKKRKGKAVPSKQVPSEGSAIGGDSSDLRGPIRNNAGLDLTRRHSPSDGAERPREDGDGQAATVGPERSRKVSSGDRPAEKRLLCLIRYCLGDVFVELLPLSSGLERPYVIEGQSWRNLMISWSKVDRVKALLRECAATWVMFIIPRDGQRPWAPPIGYHCVYELYFQKDTRLAPHSLVDNVFLISARNSYQPVREWIVPNSGGIDCDGCGSKLFAQRPSV